MKKLTFSPYTDVSTILNLKYQAYTLRNFKELPQIQRLSEEQIFAIEVVGHILPFRTNNYIVEELINWDNIPNDPIFILTFPQKDMLKPHHFEEMATILRNGHNQQEIIETANRIRLELNPHPAGQMECNVPALNGQKLVGMQHKYKETVRGLYNFLLIVSISENGCHYIRIGTKALGYWPYRFLTDPDADDLLALFEKVKQAGKHLAIMAHFSHPHELKTKAVREAILRIRETGAQIRTQSPLLSHINDQPEIWAEMWKEQVRLGCIPYYMFVARNTGAQHYFSIPLVRAWKIFRKAYQRVTGLARTVRGPSMSAKPGKIQILGVREINGEKIFILRFLQGRHPDWVLRPFFAQYDEDATWLNQLKPAFGNKKFFFEEANAMAA